MNKHSTTPLDRKRRRQQAVLEAISGEALATQQEITHALKKRGIEATQVSISRDIAELGLVKAGGRYVAGLGAVAAPSDPLAAFVRDVLPAGSNLVVIKCDTGAAPRVGLALDQLGVPGLVGSLAGDDTVFAATASAADNIRLIQVLKSRIRIPQALGPVLR